jgi:hypothetical protein
VTALEPVAVTQPVPPVPLTQTPRGAEQVAGPATAPAVSRRSRGTWAVALSLGVVAVLGAALYPPTRQAMTDLVEKVLASQGTPASAGTSAGPNAVASTSGAVTRSPTPSAKVATAGGPLASSTTPQPPVF